MQEQPDRLFGMVELIAAIFDADSPKPVRNKARDRILIARREGAIASLA